jgi:hypothetical protein
MPQAFLMKPTRSSLTLKLALKGATAATAFWLMCRSLSAFAPRRISVRSQTNKKIGDKVAYLLALLFDLITRTN